MSTKVRTKMNTSLLYNDYPIPVSPTLATAIGLNESIILQQMHYWTALPDQEGRLRNVRDGYSWVYNSVSAWSKQFPFWSESTIKRGLASLEAQNLVITGNYNRDKRDRTKWYRVNYESVAKLKDPSIPLGQIDPMQQPMMNQCVGSKCTDGSGHNDPTITRDYTETSSETNETNMSGEPDPVRQVFDHWIEVMGKNPKTTKMASKRKTKIEKALKAYGLENVKKAIDGCRANPFNMGDNQEGKRYNDIELILRDEVRIERFMELADSPPKPAANQPPPRNGFAETDYRQGLKQGADGRYRP